MKKKKHAKSKKKSAPIAKKQQPAPSTNTEKKDWRREILKMLEPGGGEISSRQGSKPPTDLKLELLKKTKNFSPLLIANFPSSISAPILEAIREKVDSKPVNVYKKHSAYSYGYEFYFDAIKSAEAAQAKILDVPLPLDDIPTTSDPVAQMDAKILIRMFKKAYLLELGDWLKGCRETILAEADAGNEEFFLNLGHLIRDRSKIRVGSLLGRRMKREGDPDSTKNTNIWRLIMAEHWVDWGLWLMPDEVGCDYVKEFSGVNIIERKSEEEESAAIKEFVKQKQIRRNTLYVWWTKKGLSKEEKEEELRRFCEEYKVARRRERAKLAELEKLHAKWISAGKNEQAKLVEIRKFTEANQDEQHNFWAARLSVETYESLRKELKLFAHPRRPVRAFNDQGDPVSQR